VSVIFKPIFIAKNKIEQENSKKKYKHLEKLKSKPKNTQRGRQPGGERKISVKMPMLMFGVYQSDSPSVSL